jgi:ABC-type Fe3+ transport system substrate-binding protein
LCRAQNGEAQTARPEGNWKEVWERTVQAAKKEGRVVFFVHRSPNWDTIFAEFNKDYPEIKVVWIVGPGATNTQRILAERRAEKYLADLFSGSPNSAYQRLYKAGALDPIKPALILPEVADPSKWFGRAHRWVDPQEMHNFVYSAVPSSLRMAYNSKLVDPREFRSYRDLLNQKWKGKIVSIDPRLSAALAQFAYYNPKLGPEYVRSLVGHMDITFSRDEHLMLNWVATEKFAICIGCRAKGAKDQGLPVDEFDKRSWAEGVALAVGGGSLSLLNRAPHPNAARVLINWFLSRRGQMVYQDLSTPDDPPNSLRIDISKEKVPEYNRLVEGTTYMDLTREEYDLAPVVKLLNEVMKAK